MRSVASFSRNLQGETIGSLGELKNSVQYSIAPEILGNVSLDLYSGTTPALPSGTWWKGSGFMSSSAFASEEVCIDDNDTSRTVK